MESQAQDYVQESIQTIQTVMVVTTDEYKSLSKAAIKEYVGLGIERMSVIEKGKTIILVMDQTRIVVPQTLEEESHGQGIPGTPRDRGGE